jgi:hypothetical protein
MISDRNEAARPLKVLTCDDVSWLMSVLDRLVSITRIEQPRISRQVETAKLAALLEMMDLLGYAFADAPAAHNALARLHELEPLLRRASPSLECLHD